MVKELVDSPLYIACLRLDGRRSVVVGAGRIGLEKIEGLLACDGDVTVIAPDAVPEVEKLAADGTIKWQRRRYDAADLNGAFLVIAATSDSELNTRIFHDGEARGMLVNVVDVPPLCNFILPAITRSGPLAIAISTAGASPALAKRMKREIAEQFGEPYAELAIILNGVREWAKQTLPTYDDRKDFFEAIVGGDPDPVELVRTGRTDAVHELIERARREAEAKFA